MARQSFVVAEQAGGIVWGVGSSPDAARVDAASEARFYGIPLPQVVLLPASGAMVSAVRDAGGDRVDWTVRDGIAVLADEPPPVLTQTPLFGVQ
jgi:hypothetical protein